MGFETVDIKNNKPKGGQTIDIPDNLKINDDKVYIKKVGNILYVIPYHNPWNNLIESLEIFTPDFMSDREQPEDQQREPLD